MFVIYSWLFYENFVIYNENVLGPKISKALAGLYLIIYTELSCIITSTLQL